MKTIGIPEDLHKELIKLKLENGNRNVAEIIRNLVYEHKKRTFLEFSDLFRESLAKNKKSFDVILKQSRKIRGEIADEWF
jgi:predicted CopG family antitoxin